jgi:hypothetical protein
MNDKDEVPSRLSREPAVRRRRPVVVTVDNSVMDPQGANTMALFTVPAKSGRRNSVAAGASVGRPANGRPR